MTQRNPLKNDELSAKSCVPSNNNNNNNNNIKKQTLELKSSFKFHFATQLLLISLVSIILSRQGAQCRISRHELYARSLQLPITSQTDVLANFRDARQQQSAGLQNTNEPTPPLMNTLNERSDNNPLGRDTSYQKLIDPRNVLSLGSDSESFSPVFHYSSADPQQEQQMQQDSALESITPPEGAATSFIDLNEPGSGAGYDSAPVDRLEDATTNNDYSPTPVLNNPLKTPIFNGISSSGQSNGDRYDHAPILVRRLPKLTGVAGSSWRYKIPSDTFYDEDGDLSHLKSSIVIEQYFKTEYQNTIEPGNSQGLMSKYLRWLQYDQNTQTLYGFPTEDDVGLNMFRLVVSDRWASTSNETIEIAIRPHQSSRAFTHSLTLSGIEWYNQRSISVPDMLTELVKSISEGVFSDHSDKNMIVISYTLAEKISNIIEERAKQIITLTWSNSSLPIHPCDLNSIESIFRQLIDNRYLTPNWSLQTHGHYDLAPSQTLLKALSPDFRPSSVSISLQGACESKRSTSSDHIKTSESPDLELKVKNRLGKIKWKLGQPIWYEIPRDTFTADGSSRNTRNLSLSLHTIDGKTLDQDPHYNFLEFEQETQTIYGLPYDLTKHIGTKELMLTARHPTTNERIHETFIIDIESQDLTTFNNRAFRVSLYFMTRINLFGPREQVLISRLMVESLGVELNFDHDQDYPDFTVIDLQKFTTSSNLDNSATLSDPANAWRFQDKIMLIDNSNTGAREVVNGEGTVFYKLTWTNETIGHFGDCPVEVIKDNVLYALERNMLDYVPPHGDLKPEDPTKNDSVRFYERLRTYFEPSLDLIHLRFEPLSACIDALEIHDLGNSDIADLADKAGEVKFSTDAPIPTTYTKPLESPKQTKEASPINSDEYWAIVVLIILVVAIFFVIMMLLMGLHTYRINQEKRFELQMKLAQARQNSMYLSSMVLSDQAQPCDIMSQQSAMAKPIYLDERSSRKPVILDNEKQLIANGTPMSPALYKPTTVQLMGQTVQTAPLKPNMTFTMDSIANMQNTTNVPLLSGNPQMFVNEDQHQSMTLNRRGTNSLTRLMGRQASLGQLSHSQSIVTVTSMTPQSQFGPNSQANVPPFVYAPMPVFYESTTEMPHEL